MSLAGNLFAADENITMGNSFSNDRSAPTTITGTYDVIAKCVHDDILWTKSEIKKYNEVTGLLASNTLYYKLYKLLETDQAHELTQLKRSHQYDVSPKNIPYQKQLVQVYKRHLRDLQNLFECFQYNYNHGIFESRILQYRASRKLSSVSVALSVLSAGKQSDPSFKLTLSASIEENAPDGLLDPISFNLFSEPVITPSGITYEKSNLIDHLQQRGKYDPLTRTPLRENQLYPNLAIKDAVLEYINRLKANYV